MGLLPSRFALLCAAAAAVATVGGTAVGGCSERAHTLNWSFDFASDELRSRADRLEAQVRKGGCAGEVVFSTELARGRDAESPGSLGSGRFGFLGRAYDDQSCGWFAQGCTEATLPSDTSLTILLSELKTPELDRTCSQSDGGAALDGATQDAESDAQIALDATSPEALDAGAYDPKAPKCSIADNALVACFDFESTLSDASSAANDASGSPSFEPAVSGQGMRPMGTAVTVPDSASLALSTLTIEIWFRADSLINLAGETNNVSILLDKDQQYDVGFDAQGNLYMEVYRGVNDAFDTNAGSSNVVQGVFTYAAFVYDGARAHIYQDGLERESEAYDIAAFAGNGGAMHIGSGSPSTTRPFNGVIDALRIWSKVRSPAEICASAGRQFAEKCR